MWLNEKFNLKYPLIQGGMARVATGHFAAQCANAGILGLIGSGGMTLEMLKSAIDEAKTYTDKIFGVNLMLLNPDADKQAELVVKEGIKVVTTGAGNPGKYMKMWKQAGITVIPVVASVAMAKRMERAGADAVIAEGCESGGHVGELTTITLVPQVKKAVSIPVIAAGGIASGKQALAALALGADGFQVGTILLSSKEAPIHPNYKEALLKAKDTGTVVTGRIAGTPVRILKNKMSKAYIQKEKEGADLMELEKFTLGGLARAVIEGDTDTGSLMAGQTAGMLHSIRPLNIIIEELFNDLKKEKEKLQEVQL